MIFDGDGCAPTADYGKGAADWSNFAFPFSTNSPGPQGASGSYTEVDPSSLTTGLNVGPQSGDSVGDANVFTTFSGVWHQAIVAQNLNTTGIVMAYARTGTSNSGGLALYEGEDFWFTFGWTPHLRLVFDNLLKAQWNPDSLVPGNLPDAPTNVKVIPGNGKALVTWSAPNSPGTSPITQYTVTVTSSGGSASLNCCSGAQLSQTFSGLSMDCSTQYSATVTATNSSGIGPPSAPATTPQGAATWLASGWPYQGTDPTTNPSVAVIMLRGVGSSMPLGTYNPVGSGDNYCSFTLSEISTSLANVASDFDRKSPALQAPPENLTDSISQYGAVILPFSYQGAYFTTQLGDVPSFTVNAYGVDQPGSEDPCAGAQTLNREVLSINAMWPTTTVIVIGHSAGGMVAKSWYAAKAKSQYDPYTPCYLDPAKGLGSARDVVALDAPINGVSEPTLLSGLLPLAPIYQAIQSHFHIAPSYIKLLYHQWNDLATHEDPALVSANSALATTFVPEGTPGDVVYEIPDCELPPTGLQCSGLTTQLLYSPWKPANPFTDYASPALVAAEPPGFLTCLHAGDALCSHSANFEDPNVIAGLAGLVQTAAGLNSGGVHSTTTLPLYPYGALSSNVLTPGQTVAINGNNFGSAAGQLMFASTDSSSVAASIVSWSNTQIQAIVPANVITAPVYVVTSAGLTSPSSVGSPVVLDPSTGAASVSVSRPIGTLYLGHNASITATVRASSGALLAGVAVKLSDGFVKESATTDSAGTATFTVTGFGPDSFTVFSGTAYSVATLNWQAPPLENLSLTTPTGIAAPGAGVTVIATLTDSSGNPTSGQPVNFSTYGPAAATLSATQATTDSTGKAAISVSSSTAGDAVVSARANDDNASASADVLWGPSVTSVSPTFGPSAGGTTLTINGKGFTASAIVNVGAHPATIANASSAAITVTTPATNASATVSVTVIDADITSKPSSSDQFTYYTGPPIVSGLNPGTGSAAGGTLVTLTGNNLVPGATVTVGNAPATNVVFGNAQTLTFVTPAGSGTVDVRVTNPAGTSATTTADLFKYVSSMTPSVTSVSPNSVSTASCSGTSYVQTNVTIAGTNFVSGATVTFSGQAATNIKVVSSTSITALSPSLPPGVYDVVVKTSYGSSAVTSADRFTIIQRHTQCAPDYKGGLPITPPSGPVGTIITISGMYLAGIDTTVTFTSDSSDGVVVLAISNPDGSVTVAVPPGALTGPLWVNTPAGPVGATLPFTVTPCDGRTLC
jgi:IPT/TIG domain/Bacterial Ig-like domain (group 1)/Fibronectin type III domain